MRRNSLAVPAPATSLKAASRAFARTPEPRCTLPAVQSILLNTIGRRLDDGAAGARDRLTEQIVTGSAVASRQPSLEGVVRPYVLECGNGTSLRRPSMSERVQSYKNHTRFLPAWAFSPLVLLANVLNTVRYLWRAPSEGTAFEVIVSVALLTMGLLARTQALTVQDCVIPGSKCGCGCGSLLGPDLQAGINQLLLASSPPCVSRAMRNCPAP